MFFTGWFMCEEITDLPGYDLVNCTWSSHQPAVPHPWKFHRHCSWTRSLDRTHCRKTHQTESDWQWAPPRHLFLLHRERQGNKTHSGGRIRQLRRGLAQHLGGKKWSRIWGTTERAEGERSLPKQKWKGRDYYCLSRSFPLSRAALSADTDTDSDGLHTHKHR